jgi:ribosomal protein S27E
MARLRGKIRLSNDHHLMCIECNRPATIYRNGRSNVVTCDGCGATQDLEQAFAGASHQVAQKQLSRLKSFMERSRVEVVIRIKGRHKKNERTVLFGYPPWMEPDD